MAAKVSSGKASRRTSAFWPGLDAMDLPFLHPRLDEHLGEVGEVEDGLPGEDGVADADAPFLAPLLEDLPVDDEAPGARGHRAERDAAFDVGDGAGSLRGAGVGEVGGRLRLGRLRGGLLGDDLQSGLPRLDFLRLLREELGVGEAGQRGVLLLGENEVGLRLGRPPLGGAQLVTRDVPLLGERGEPLELLP